MVSLLVLLWVHFLLHLLNIQLDAIMALGDNLHPDSIKTG